MQTFVLVSQSPKKYYVHNDIFRYQDEVFADTESDTENVDEGPGEFMIEMINFLRVATCLNNPHCFCEKLPAVIEIWTAAIAGAAKKLSPVNWLQGVWVHHKNVSHKSGLRCYHFTLTGLLYEEPCCIEGTLYQIV